MGEGCDLRLVRRKKARRTQTEQIFIESLMCAMCCESRGLCQLFACLNDFSPLRFQLKIHFLRKLSLTILSKEPLRLPHRSLFKYIILCVYFWLCWVFLVVDGLFSSWGKSGRLPSCAVQASHFTDFSRGGARAVRPEGFSSTWALKHRPNCWETHPQYLVNLLGFSIS